VSVSVSVSVSESELELPWVSESVSKLVSGGPLFVASAWVLESGLE
jgi:hypothetical protein